MTDITYVICSWRLSHVATKPCQAFHIAHCDYVCLRKLCSYAKCDKNNNNNNNNIFVISMTAVDFKLAFNVMTYNNSDYT